MMRIAAEHLATSNPDRVIKSVRSVELYKREVFLTERITAICLVIVTVLLLAIAALGIFGLATFNVSTRTKQIGTRRAVGARKRDIIRHFLIENGLITSAGVVVGLRPGARAWATGCPGNTSCHGSTCTTSSEACSCCGS